MVSTFGGSGLKRLDFPAPTRETCNGPNRRILLCCRASGCVIAVMGCDNRNEPAHVLGCQTINKESCRLLSKTAVACARQNQMADRPSVDGEIQSLVTLEPICWTVWKLRQIQGKITLTATCLQNTEVKWGIRHRNLDYTDMGSSPSISMMIISFKHGDKGIWSRGGWAQD
jgi:hypothetical protein